MRRNFGWRSFTRVWRSVVRVLTRRSFRRKSKKQVVEKTKVALETRRDEPLRSVDDAASEKRGKSGDVSFDKTTSWDGFGERKTGTAPAGAEIAALTGAKKPEILAKNAFDETRVQKTNPDGSQVVENKLDTDGVEEEKKDENADADVLKQDVAPLCSTENATLKDNAQLQLSQGIRRWVNDEGKIVVKAALEIELSARSTEFVFLRSARGTLYRYPLRRLSLDDRVWIANVLGVSVEIETFTCNKVVPEKSVAPANVEAETSAVASEVVNFDDFEIESRVAASGVVDFDDFEAEPRVAVSEVVDFESVESVASQTILNRDVEEFDNGDLRLDFGEGGKDDKASEAGECDEGEATSYDLRLNFWEDWDDVSDESTTEKKSFDERTQLVRLNGLSRKDELERRVRQSADASKENEATRRSKEMGNKTRRKKETKRNNVTSSDAEYYEPFSRLEPAELDGALYDYFDDFDAIRDEIEAERIIDYYDRTYGDARYRNDDGERE